MSVTGRRFHRGLSFGERQFGGMAALPLPVQPESLKIPANDGLGLDDSQCASQVRLGPGDPTPTAVQQRANARDGRY